MELSGLFQVPSTAKQCVQSVLMQARKNLTQHSYGLDDQGEHNERRLTSAASLT
jgi:hypothetical protein